jgi:hypothetical protein
VSAGQDDVACGGGGGGGGVGYILFFGANLGPDFLGMFSPSPTVIH